MIKSVKILEKKTVTKRIEIKFIRKRMKFKKFKMIIDKINSN